MYHQTLVGSYLTILLYETGLVLIHLRFDDRRLALLKDIALRATHNKCAGN